MIGVVLINYDEYTMKEIENLLGDYESIVIGGMYSDPSKAIEEISRINPEVVFLDIDIPHLGGIDVASTLISSYPFLKIVMISSDGESALEAFELNALDYILKPISKVRLQKTVGRIMELYKNTEKQEISKKFIIQTLGKFQAGWENQRPIKWRTEKIKELFAFLIHNANTEVSKEEILKAVFSTEKDRTKCIHQLHNGIYYIRKTFIEYGIGRSEIIIQGKYMLKLGNIEIDSQRFKNYFQMDIEENEEMLENIVAYYKGDYFGEKIWHWADAERDKLFNRYLEYLISLAKLYIRNEEYNKAERILIKAFMRNPCMEDLTKILLNLYRLINRKDLAVKHYKNYEKIIKKELGMGPSLDVQRLLKSF